MKAWHVSAGYQGTTSRSPARDGIRFASAFIAILVILLCAVSGVAQGKTDLTISAAISLQDALNEISRAYQQSHPGTAIHSNFGASGTLQRQIEQGAPVDLFVSASPKEMDSLESQSLILAGTRKDLVRNTVVLIVPNEKSSLVAGFQDLTKPQVKYIAIGEPQTVPAGTYARQVLLHFGTYDRLGPKLVFGSNVRQVLDYVQTGNADAGIVYATDARITNRVRVVATAPEDSHSPVIYPVAVIKGARNPSAAQAFERFLLGDQAGAILKNYGFTPVVK
jgi:molybdate transport system substrate-binding protein